MWATAKAGSNQTKNLGMTAPISTANPESKDLELTADLKVRSYLINSVLYVSFYVRKLLNLMAALNQKKS